jgi:hypothetical protein
MSANGAQLFIHGEHGIYSIVIPGTNTDSPVWLAALAEAACGFRVSDGSIVEELPPEERLSLLRQVNNKLKAEKNDDAWAKYGKWLLDDGVDRFVSPLSTKKMVEQERQTPKNTE